MPHNELDINTGMWESKRIYIYIYNSWTVTLTDHNHGFTSTGKKDQNNPILVI